MSYFLGVDFSINYASACLARTDLNEFHWIGCINTKVSKKFTQFTEDVHFEYPNIHFIHPGMHVSKDKSAMYHETERKKLLKQFVTCSSLISEVLKIVGSNPIVAVSLEGLSFGSPGNSLLDLAHATGIFKSDLFPRVIQSPDQLFIFSPSELKNSIGAKGNANKVTIFEHFLSDPKIEALRGSHLWQFCSKYKDEIYNGKVVDSPFMDMIDATLNVIKLSSF